MTDKRIYWIDAAKCVGMFLVIFNHFNADVGQGAIKVFFASFHMPLFFVISGLTIKGGAASAREIGSFVRNRSYGIMVPYYLWAFIFCSGFTVRNIAFIIWGSNRSLGLAKSNQVLWFLPCLFLAVVITRISLAVIAAYAKTDRIGNIAVFILTASYFVLGWVFDKVMPTLESMDYPFSLNLSFTASGFILTGYLIKTVMMNIGCYRNVDNIGRDVIIGVASFAAAVIFAFCNKPAITNDWGRVVMALALFGNYWLFIVSGIAGSVFVIAAVRLLGNRSSIISRIGRETLTILAVHKAIIKAVSRLLNNAEPGIRSILLLTMLAIIVLLLSYLIALGIRKTVPNLSGAHAGR